MCFGAGYGRCRRCCGRGTRQLRDEIGDVGSRDRRARLSHSCPSSVRPLPLRMMVMASPTMAWGRRPPPPSVGTLARPPRRQSVQEGQGELSRRSRTCFPWSGMTQTPRDAGFSNHRPHRSFSPMRSDVQISGTHSSRCGVCASAPARHTRLRRRRWCSGRGPHALNATVGGVTPRH